MVNMSVNVQYVFEVNIPKIRGFQSHERPWGIPVILICKKSGLGMPRRSMVQQLWLSGW